MKSVSAVLVLGLVSLFSLCAHAAVDKHFILEMTGEETAELLSAPLVIEGFPVGIRKEEGLRHWLDGYYSAVNRFGASNLLGLRPSGAKTDTPVSAALKTAQEKGKEREVFVKLLGEDTRRRAKEREAQIALFESQGLELHKAILRDMRKLTTYGVGSEQVMVRGLPTTIEKSEWGNRDYWAVGYFDGFLQSKNIDLESDEFKKTMGFASPWTFFTVSPYDGLVKEVREEMNQNPRKELQALVYQQMKAFEKDWERMVKLEELKKAPNP